MSKVRTDWNQLHQGVDHLIRAGDIGKARSELERLDLAVVPRGFSAKIAGLFTRAGLAEQAIRILGEWVRPRKRLLQPATESETAEYAFALQRLGGVEEALGLLNSIEAPAVETRLYRAICRFAQWDYESALPDLLEIESRQDQLDPYFAMVAQTNTAAALIFTGRTDQARRLLERLEKTTASTQSLRLLSNTFELQAQLAVATEDWSEAERTLEKASALTRSTQIVDSLYIEKWQAITEALRSRSIEPLVRAENRAKASGHSETLRDLDFFRLKVAFDPQIFLRLFFGTPFHHYRERLKQAFPDQMIPLEIGFSQDFQPANPSAEDLDGLAGLAGELAIGNLPHGLLLLLTSDFYRAFRTAQIHSHLFPGEHFNTSSSLTRVHQVVKRLREALVEQLPDLEVTTEDGRYRLRWHSGSKVSIRLPQRRDRVTGTQLQLQLLSRERPNGFRSVDVQETLGISKAAANKLISSWRDSELIRAMSTERSPLYEAQVDRSVI
jgi:hypothetical protein